MKAAASPASLIAAGLAGLALLLGGGGSPSPASEFALELLSVVAALAWLWLPMAARPRPVPAAWLVSGLVLLLPLLQLVPLPPGVWTALGGQDDRIAALSLVGAADSWQPISRSPAQTLASLLSMIPPVLLLLAVSALDRAERSPILWAVIAVAAAGAVFGALQLSLGDAAPRFYPGRPLFGLTGFQANRNAEADVLLIALLAAVTVLSPYLVAGRRRRGTRLPALLASPRSAAIVLAAAALLFLLAAILTASRMGIALIPLVLIAAIVLAAVSKLRLGRWRWLPVVLVVVSVGIVAGSLLLHDSTQLGKVASRFVQTGDERTELWRDAWYAIHQSWPFGVGMGGAQSALIGAERLEVLDPFLPNRVHNDYLEIVLEAGVVGVALLAAIVLVLARQAWRGWREDPESHPQTALGIAILLIIGLHSVVDYPLRSMSLSCLAGLAAGLLVSRGRKSLPEGRPLEAAT
jgi:O-antigen ligase